MADAIEKFLEGCSSAGLYSSIDFSDEEFYDFMRDQHIQFDRNCIWCKRETAFRTNSSVASQNGITINSPTFPSSVRYFKAQFFCVREPIHQYTYYWKKKGHTAVKIGQDPALEDIASADIQRYRPVMHKGYFSELHRATGLASHGIGIGSFVYLRRIFERLIEDHRQTFEKANSAIDGYDSMRMADKIAALKSVLPETVVKYRALYAILSKGIHELTEDECRKLFPPVRAGIIAILEQDLQNKEKADKEAALEKEMQQILQDLKGTGADGEAATTVE